MKQFIRDIASRGGEWSSKKTWYNLACLTATAVIGWTAYKLPTAEGMDDWVFIWLFGIYLITVGGFEVVLEILRLIKGTPASTTVTSTSVTTSGTPS